MMDNVPELRFSEFNDNWGETKLSEIYPKIRNGFVGTATPFYVESGIPYLQGKNVKNGKIKDTGLIFINNEFHCKNTKSQLVLDDIIMVQSGHVGECTLITETYVDSNCHALIVLTPIKNIHSKFYIYFFYTEYGKKLIYKIKTGNTIEHILSSELKILKVSLPLIEEQKKIAKFLTTVDTKIEQLTKKQALLEQYKKGVSQKLFSQEIRFRKIIDNGELLIDNESQKTESYPDWVEKKLGDITKKVSEKNKKNIHYPVYSINNKEGFIPQSEQFDGVNSKDRGFDISLYKIIHPETFAYNPARINVGSLGYSGKLDNIIISSLYVCFKTIDCINDNFISYYFDSYDFNKNVLRNTEGGVREYLFYANFSRIKFKFPSIQEQEKIANFLSSIDTKIEQESKQLNQTQQFKKALLQQMFV